MTFVSLFFFHNILFNKCFIIVILLFFIFVNFFLYLQHKLYFKHINFFFLLLSLCFIFIFLLYYKITSTVCFAFREYIMLIYNFVTNFKCQDPILEHWRNFVSIMNFDLNIKLSQHRFLC